MVWIVIILFFLIPAVFLIICDPAGKRDAVLSERENYVLKDILEECRLYINDSVSRDYSELFLSREET